MPTSPSLRAADSDRERTAALLGDHLAAGRLDVVEFDERLSAAYSAVTLDDLDAPHPRGPSGEAPYVEHGRVEVFGGRGYEEPRPDGLLRPFVQYC